MRIKNESLALAAVLMLGQGFAQADSRGFGVNWLLGGGLTFGGDKLAEVEVSNGGNTDNVDIDAGELFYIAGGLIIPFSDTGFSLQTTIGWHRDGVVASNGDASFERFPLELIPFYNYKRHRIGAGLTYNLSPELDLDDAGGSKVEFDDALGYVIEYDYVFGKSALDGGLMLGARYAFIQYEVDSIDGTSVTNADDIDGNYFGITFGFSF